MDLMEGVVEGPPSYAQVEASGTEASSVCSSHCLAEVIAAGISAVVVRESGFCGAGRSAPTTSAVILPVFEHRFGVHEQYVG